MNKIDTILLIHTGVVCHLVSAENGFKHEKIFAITFELMIMFPFFYFILYLIVKDSRLQKALKNIYQKFKSCIGRRNDEQEFDFSSSVNSLSDSVHQSLIESIALGDNNINHYGAVNNSTY